MQAYSKWRSGVSGMDSLSSIYRLLRPRAMPPSDALAVQRLDGLSEERKQGGGEK